MLRITVESWNSGGGIKSVKVETQDELRALIQALRRAAECFAKYRGWTP